MAPKQKRKAKTNLSKHMGRVIRRIRLSRGMTLADLCSKTGGSVAHLSEIECGLRECGLGYLTRIARAFNVQPWRILHPTEWKEITKSRKTRGRFQIPLDTPTDQE